MEELRQTIKKAAPEAEEAISYQIPTFKLNGNLVHFGGFKKHIGFYPAPRGIEAFKKELSQYKGAKGSVQFPLDEPMPLQLISKIVKFRVKAYITLHPKGAGLGCRAIGLISKIVKFRVKENEERARGKK